MGYQSKPVPGGEPSPGERVFLLQDREEQDTEQVADDVPAGPPPSPLRRLLEHEEARSAALRRADRRGAKRAFAQVVADLDDLLDMVKAQLRLLIGGDQAAVRDGVSASGAADALSVLPLRDVADLLGLPRDTAGRVLDRLRESGGLGGEDRRPMLRALDQFRLELRIVADDQDHTLLDRLVQVVVMLSGQVAAAVTATSWAAEDDPDNDAINDAVDGAVVRAALAVLAALTLEQAADLVREPHQTGDPSTQARAAHEALLRDLPDTDARPRTATRAAVLIRVCAARTTLIPLEWTDKHAYWDLLDRITTATEHAETLTGPRDELATLQP
jgi:Bacterial regulatory proteins, crp family